MTVTIETPQGGMTVTVTGGVIGNAQVDPDGVVNISFFPMEEPPPDESPETAGFVGD